MIKILILAGNVKRILIVAMYRAIYNALMECVEIAPLILIALLDFIVLETSVLHAIQNIYIEVVLHLNLDVLSKKVIQTLAQDVDKVRIALPLGQIIVILPQILVLIRYVPQILIVIQADII